MRARLGAGLGLALGLMAACGTTIQPAIEAKPSAPDAPAFSHRTYDALLRRHVDRHGLVDYAGLVQDRAELDRYYARLAVTSPDSEPARFPEYSDRLAYWLNAYNAAVIMAVLGEYPISSVREVLPPGGLFFMPRRTGFFAFQRVVVGGRDFSLEGLQDHIREQFDDPRIHFALVGAAKGYPRLRNHAYAAAELEDQLDEDARRFVAEDRGVRIDRVKRTIGLSEIFERHQTDFTGWLQRQGAEPSLVAYVRRYQGGERLAALDACRGCPVAFFEFDWTLNDQRADDD